VFDSVCANAVMSLAELYYLWHALATLRCCFSFGSPACCRHNLSYFCRPFI